MNWLITILNIQKTLKEIRMNINQLAETLVAIKAQLTKAKEEIVNKITSLEEALENVTLSPEAEAALASLNDAAQALDDIVPDEEPVEEPVEEPIQ
jgi:uncharacterized coiled-coil DUF342 family protein